ncbi:uncharacterized protein [Periplaneta americana]|uniref:uncharacterized protein isoform X4 n=1 Tax=Periplaneta americana TaxID=6978 RepID=UPI0037E784EF
MDVIKMELEGDPLAIETHYITEEEKKPILKMELEVDPLAIETSDITDVEEKEPILKDVTIKTPIKTECKDYDLPSKVKYEAQKQWFDLDMTKEDVKQEVTAEDNEVFTDSCSTWIALQHQRRL